MLVINVTVNCDIAMVEVEKSHILSTHLIVSVSHEYSVYVLFENGEKYRFPSTHMHFHLF